MNEDEFRRELDLLKHTHHVAPDYLAPRILASVNAHTPLEQVIAWFGVSHVRGVAVAMLPLVLGFGLGISNIDDPESWHEVEALVFVDTIEEYDDDEI